MRFGTSLLKVSPLYVAISLTLLVGQKSVEAQTIPFFITGAGSIVGNDDYPSYPTGSSNKSLLPILAIQAPAGHDATGTSTAGGAYVGEGSIRIIKDADLSTLSAEFESGEAFKFASARGTLACDYGVTRDTQQTPKPKVFAKDPGVVQLVQIAGLTTPEDPTDDRFFAYFIAEFIPTLDSECTGKFAPNRLKGGSFIMYAFSTSPLTLAIAGEGEQQQPFLVNPNAGEPLTYGWIGIGTLKFKFPFGLLP